MFLALPVAALLAPAATVAWAQPAPPSGYDPNMPSPPPAGAGGGRQQRNPNRPRLYQMSYDQMRPKQRQRLAAALAGPNNPPVPAEQARSQWDSMDQGQRRQVVRQVHAMFGGRRQQGQAGGMAPPQ
jgi:hypothetical protein